MPKNMIRKSNFIAASVFFLSFIFLVLLLRAGESPEQAVELIVRGDDMGMTHSANEAFEIAFSWGILTAGGIIVPAPWFEEAARRGRENWRWSVGVHLCLNAEWKDYRWRPVCSVKAGDA